MDFFNVLTLLGGLSLFLFGMEVMGKSLEKSAGNRLKISTAARKTTKMEQNRFIFPPPFAIFIRIQ